ncbi:Ldh family oxidoreductase [Leucobacter sp. G161]|uniref:Ldh family oxidoreductase n=1 Tax=Leucobacter sp. G161 TaxID=663704 RepID=UPI00073CEABF|nr:Ldh family oxidoreductase [Leucobacter sp. G161]KUF06810.1 lactate dehydrogenase [Leucobacter sp. G161]
MVDFNPANSENTSRSALGSQIRFEALEARIRFLLEQAGADPGVAAVLAENCASCERDGAVSHGVFRVPGYLKSLRSGWADGAAVPRVEESSAAFIRVDAANGFSQPAINAASSVIDEALESVGVAVVAIRNSHHFSSLWPDIEPFARRGVLGITMVTGGASVIPRGADRKMLGTNPFAFATPVAGSDPLVMDFATSTMSHGDLQLRAQAGEPVPVGTGTGTHGRDTTDPDEILESGGLLPFGGHKGANISIMVEILASGLTGGAFSYRDDLVFAEAPEDGGTARTGQLLILIDPERGGDGSFADRIAQLVAELRASGLERLPSDRRYMARARANREGIPVTDAVRMLFAE